MDLLISNPELLGALDLHPSKREVVSAFWSTSLSMLLDGVHYILQEAWLVFGERNTAATRPNIGRSIIWIQLIKRRAKCCRSCCRETSIIFEFHRELALAVANIVLVEIVVEVVAGVLGIKDIVLGDAVLTIFLIIDHLF